MIPSRKAWVGSMTCPLLSFLNVFCFIVMASRNFGNVKRAARRYMTRVLSGNHPFGGVLMDMATDTSQWQITACD